MSVNSKMTAIADEIRELSGTTGAMGLDAMATNIGDANGEVSTQTDLLAQIVSALEGKAAGGSSEPVLQTKTVTPTTSQQVITPDSGYDGLSNVTVNAMPTATQATPSVSIDSAGKITATATQTAGYVSAGTKSATKQLTTQAAKTITPTKSSQTAIASGVYTTGAVTVKGDSNLVAGNIKSGVSIFGVAGTYAGSGGDSGGDTSVEDGLITKTISGAYVNDRVTSIGIYTFCYCSKLTTVSFPVATSIGSCAFQDCYSLTTVSFPVATSIGGYAFHYCSKLTTVSFPVATSIGGSAFCYCFKLATVSFPKVTSIGGYAFQNCYNLKSLYLTGSSLCKLSNSNAFSSTPIGGYSTSAGTYGSIYVPASLLTSYQTATNWTYFSSRMVGI